jgi:HpcH/HpaI aldolase/citrate lyase family
MCSRDAVVSSLGSPSKALELCLITTDFILAQFAQQVGIERIMVDLERLGKEKRQAGQNLFLSQHREEDIPHLRQLLVSTELLVRINPLYDHSKEEIEKVLAYGADIIMLPMFETATQVNQFIEMVQGRARVSLLLENKIALMNLDSILKLRGIDEIHIGLNDLRISLGLDVIFEVFCLGILDEISDKIHQAGIRFGVGGVTSPQITTLPIAPEHIIAEQVRLGSTLALLGRSFRTPFEQHPNLHCLKAAVDAIHHCVQYWQQAPLDKHLQNRAELQQAVLCWRSARNSQSREQRLMVLNVT